MKLMTKSVHGPYSDCKKGDLELPLGGFGAARGGLWRRLRMLRRPAAGLCRGGATPARWKRRGLADEDQGDEGELLVGSV